MAKTIIIPVAIGIRDNLIIQADTYAQTALLRATTFSFTIHAERALTNEQLLLQVADALKQHLHQ